ncbi:MAG: hydroxymethylbilane synthase [Actinomycetota bacterium]
MSDVRRLRVGTRGSALARIQTRIVTSGFMTDLPVDVVVIETEGDDVSIPLSSAGRPGVFVGALRSALLAGDVDVIVHSYKDLPTASIEGVVLGAVPVRADPRDAIVARRGATLGGLTPGAVVGTSSPRRAARVRHLRPDVQVRPIRGNVDTRLRLVDEGVFDAVILAVAGLQRLERSDAITEVLSIDEMIPAPAQGALAVECRQSDDVSRRLLGDLDHPESRICAAAERAVLAGLATGCQTALGALATHRAGRLRLIAELSDPVDDEHERHVLETVSAVDDEASARDLGLEMARRFSQGSIIRRWGQS